jgi:ubiquinone/menaquinone biosynthesis C-methylase UbiE
MPKTPLPQKYTEEYFMTDCDGYDSFLAGSTSLRLMKALSSLNPQTNQRILDVGCGRGEIVKECNKVGSMAIGVDYADASMKIAKTISPVVKACATYLPFRDDFFDKIVFLEVIEHLDRKDSEKALSEINRVLRDGGCVVSSTQNFLPILAIFFRFYRKIELLSGKNVFAEVHVDEKSYSIIKSLFIMNGFQPTLCLERLPIKRGLPANKMLFKKAFENLFSVFSYFLPQVSSNLWVTAKKVKTTKSKISS